MRTSGSLCLNSVKKSLFPYSVAQQVMKYFGGNAMVLLLEIWC